VLLGFQLDIIGDSMPRSIRSFWSARRKWAELKDWPTKIARH
jgi:hypothetical protein